MKGFKNLEIHISTPRTRKKSYVLFYIQESKNDQDHLPNVKSSTLQESFFNTFHLGVMRIVFSPYKSTKCSYDTITLEKLYIDCDYGHK